MPETKPQSSVVDVVLLDKDSSHSDLPEKLCLDDMLQKYCGEFGVWQRRHFLLGSLGMIVDAFLTMVMIFADRQPRWYPIHVSSAGMLLLQQPGGTLEWIRGSAATSSPAEFGIGLVQALFFGGTMIGAGLFGHLSDSRWGRKVSLIAATTLSAIVGILAVVSPNYWSYAFLRFLAGVSKGGVALCSFVLTTEPIGPTKRGLAGISTFYFFCVGMVVISGVAYVFRTWRSLYFASSVPSFLFLVFVLPFISESPRWCLINGKMNQAMEIMHKIAKTNGQYLPKHVILSLKCNNDELDGNSNLPDAQPQPAMTNLLCSYSRRMRIRLLILAMAINFSCAVTYYGLTLNVVNLGTNLYLNVISNAVAETLAILFSTSVLDKFGRKPLAIVTQLITGVICVAGSLLSGNGNGTTSAGQMVCCIVGMFGAAATFNLLYIYTVELFPTVVRNAALGYATQAAETGAVLSPFLVALGGGNGISLAVFGFYGIIGGVLAFFLPETLNEPLYDTVAAEIKGLDAALLE